MVAENTGAEPLTSPPEVTGGRAPEEMQPRQPLLQSAPAGSSKGAGPADRNVPAGPPLNPHHHVVQDGAAEGAAGTTAGKSGPRKTKGAKKKGATAAAAGTPGAKKPHGKHGPARPTGSGSPPKRHRRAGEHSTLGSDSEAEGGPDQTNPGKGSGNTRLGTILTRPTPTRPISSEQEETSSTITSVTDAGKEEGEWSGEETEQKPISSRLFQAEHFQRLLTKVISTLNYQMETPEVPRSSASAELDPRGFKKPVKIQTFSPFPDYFEDVIREEWANPGGGTSLLSLARRFYSLPDNIMEDLRVPLIDAPVVALHSGVVMPKDGENALKDVFDCKNENALKKAHEAMSLAIRSAATLSNFTRATAIWADNLLQDPEVSPLVLRRTLLKMKRAAEFAADASQDNIQFCARAQAANIIIRRNIWLKHWKVDALSKTNLATEKFSGRLLFGESNLDKVLVETREKKKAMPSSSYRRERDTKNRPSRSFRPNYTYNSGRGRDNRDKQFKSFKFNRRPIHKNTANYGAAKGGPHTKQTA
ncbi:UNVERIFIED_CONTAM: hypothetical protein K2H54_055529 [Gekko kuhli]